MLSIDSSALTHRLRSRLQLPRPSFVQRSGFGAAVVLLLLLSLPKETLAIEIEVGKPFPALKLPTLDGELRSIEDFRGTKVVLHVFASW